MGGERIALWVGELSCLCCHFAGRISTSIDAGAGKVRVAEGRMRGVSERRWSENDSVGPISVTP